jgi:predicted unusual protein kinase regulating ubiquinone biosynthesis (AarF/ABC1/UbiB family)
MSFFGFQAILNSTELGDVSTLKFGKLSDSLNNIAYIFPIKFPPFYSLVIRTLTILEGESSLTSIIRSCSAYFVYFYVNMSLGLALSMDNRFRLISGAYPFIANQILTSSSPEIKDLLKRLLLTPEGNIRWNKLENFLKIALNADLAIEGPFR